MRVFKVRLDDAAAEFYGKIAERAGIGTERVLADTLFRAAAEYAVAAGARPQMAVDNGRQRRYNK